MSDAPGIVVFGAQQGDEGKARVVDELAWREDIKYVVRAQGGQNAGHTVEPKWGMRRALHGVPSGIYYEKAICVIGPGTVMKPDELCDEIQSLAEDGISIERIRISEAAHMVLPDHCLVDRLDEERRGKQQIGSTQKGVSPAYADKAARIGLRFSLLRDLKQCETCLKAVLPQKNHRLSFYGHPGLTVDDFMQVIEPAARLLAPLVCDTYQLLDDAMKSRQSILIEGQLGIMKDVNMGFYPRVTSSPTNAASMIGACGLDPSYFQRRIGVAKPYLTAIGTSVMPTAHEDELADHLREKGNEYGATTGRPRQIGALDLMALAWALRRGGATEVILTKLDVLSDCQEIPLCRTYLHERRELSVFPGIETAERAQAVISKLPGWKQDISGVRRAQDLPCEAVRLIRDIEAHVGLPISLVCVGAPRSHCIPMRHG